MTIKELSSHNHRNAKQLAVMISKESLSEKQIEELVFEYLEEAGFLGFLADGIEQ